MVFHVFHGHACAWFHVVHGHGGFCFHVHGGSCFPLSCMVVHVFQHAGGSSYSLIFIFYRFVSCSWRFMFFVHGNGVSMRMVFHVLTVFMFSMVMVINVS